MAVRIEVDVTTGKQRTVELTANEIADAQERTRLEAEARTQNSIPPTRAELAARIAALEAKLVR